MAKKYDIIVYEVDVNGQKKSHIENGIMGNSPSEIINIYKMCGQEVQIVKEYSDEESNNYGRKQHIDENDVVMNTSNGGTGLMKISNDMKQKIEEYSSQKEHTKNDLHTKQTNHNTPPKFLNVGGIKCKIENGKLYQKQWIKLSDNESEEIRIISNKTNKIFPLTDKHIEIMKWVLVEESDYDENKNLELLNG